MKFEHDIRLNSCDVWRSHAHATIRATIFESEKLKS